MAAADDLLTRLSMLDSVADHATGNSSTPQDVKDAALRTVAVQGLAAFEQFIRDRGEEWSAHLTAARVPASALAGGSAPFSNRIVETLPRRFKDLEDHDRTRLVDELAKTLTSFSSGSVVGHGLFFAWPGSNIQPGDIDAMLRLTGVSRGWGDLTAAWQILDPRFPGGASAESKMKAFASLRHLHAHEANAPVDAISIRSVTKDVRMTAMLIDVCVSQAIAHTCRGEKVPDKIGSKIKKRSVDRDGGRWSEYPPKSTRAFRRHATLDRALSESALRARPRDESVVAMNGVDLVDWRAAF